MPKFLVIVESPAKANTINRYLGQNYFVLSSVGHIRDLPQKGQKATWRAEDKAYQRLINSMGIDPENGWSVYYQILPGKEKVVAELKHAAREADAIYLATDRDREGEAIAWHLRQAIGDCGIPYHRVIFSEITKNAIREAFAHPVQIDDQRVHAQQARRFLDRIVGYMVSPLLWNKVARGLSAGRVQSVALRMVVEREREIQAFKPEEYWEIHADVHAPASSQNFLMQVTKYQNEDFRPQNEQQAHRALRTLQNQQLMLTQREDKKTQTRPQAPFITATLQQAASVRLGFGVRRTMSLAQKLYEAGFITYMRTDATNLSKEATGACRDYIVKHYDIAYLPAHANVYKSKNSNAQEAHEAIRPTDVNVVASKLNVRNNDERKLYELIWRRFVACQMANARYLSTTLIALSGDYQLRARGRVLEFDGFTRVLPSVDKEGDILLPDVQPQCSLEVDEWKPSQHFTKPPARYSEASLVRELEKRSIGRPSTYAAIISTIQERGYVSLHKKRFHAEKIGEVVTSRLQQSFANLMDYGFTAQMEQKLDHIASGKEEWKRMLDKFYRPFKTQLEKAGGEEGMQRLRAAETEIPCPNCARAMLVRSSPDGLFLGCSGYGSKESPCRTTINLNAEEPLDEEQENAALRAYRRCVQCNSAMHPYLVDDHQRLHICTQNPECSGNVLEKGDFTSVKPTIICDKCGADMVLKKGRFGKYFDCNAENCRNTRKVLANGEVAPPKMTPIPLPQLRCRKVDDHYVLRDGAAGLFLAASQFPKNRETRPITVTELRTCEDRLDPKYRYLLDAPQCDDRAFDTEIRFSRKLQTHYLMTQKAGRATGWRAYFQDGEWKITRGRAKG